MQFDNEDDFVDYLADKCEKCDKAVKKVRSAIRALRTQRNRALETQLTNSESVATELVQATLQLIKKAPKQPALANITENDEFMEMKASFKKTVRQLNVCMQDIQQQSLAVSYESTVAGEEIHTQDAVDIEDPVETEALELEVVYQSDQVDVDAQIEAENREEVISLAKDTVVLKDLMGEAVDMIKEQGEQLDEVDRNVETAANTAESATEELKSARKHQKATQKIKMIIGAVCGCLVLTAIAICVWQFGFPDSTGAANSRLPNAYYYNFNQTAVLVS